MISAMGFLAELYHREPAPRDRQKTARFPGGQSQRSCVEIYDLAPVSMIVRSVSNSARLTVPPVSTNVRQKTPLIARRAVHDCAPLHILSQVRYTHLGRWIHSRRLIHETICFPDYVPSSATAIAETVGEPANPARPGAV